MKQCTGCGKYDNEPLGLNKNGEPYLACCPDSNYVEVKNRVKLYTEEQLRKHLYNHSDEFFDQLTPIELPSDEEIEEDTFHQSNEYAYGYKDAFNYIKRQILNQNK